jgi:NAD(P)-dependent dehydrogenase (short-subunit alcohol dehydrogenase family)
MAINARGTMLVCKHAIPVMIAGGGGSIVNISSGQSLSGDLTNVAYSAGKAAVNTLTRHVATTFGDRGIRCNAIAPGLVLTPALDAGMPEPLRPLFVEQCLVPRLGEPRDVAETVLFLASDAAAYISGQILSVDGGILSHIPTVPGIRKLMAQMAGA